MMIQGSELKVTAERLKSPSLYLFSFSEITGPHNQTAPGGGGGQLWPHGGQTAPCWGGGGFASRLGSALHGTMVRFARAPPPPPPLESEKEDRRREPVGTMTEGACVLREAEEPLDTL